MKFFLIKIFVFIFISLSFSNDVFFHNGKKVKIPTPENYCDIGNTKYGKFRLEYHRKITQQNFSTPVLAKIYGRCSDTDPYFKFPILVMFANLKVATHEDQSFYNKYMSQNLPEMTNMVTNWDLNNPELIEKFNNANNSIIEETFNESIKTNFNFKSSKILFKNSYNLIIHTITEVNTGRGSELTSSISAKVMVPNNLITVNMAGIYNPETVFEEIVRNSIILNQYSKRLKKINNY